MCGIAGFIDFNRTGLSDLSTLKAMTDTMVHRGPDGSGYEVFKNELANVGFGHRRLSILDLSDEGKQPMGFRDLYITFNGEIYNYVEIRKVLRDLGHTFKSDSDTEVVLHAYAEWGKDCLSRFIGMFAFVIYDSYEHKIFAVRDRGGAKPLFYYWKDGLFLFASELKAIANHPQFKKELNLDAVASFMQFGYVPTPHCIWNNTKKLPAGHSLELNITDKEISQNQYWNVYDSYNKPKLRLDFKEAVLQTEDVLKSACNYRMVSDVPVGVFLSGGYDSTTVAALLQSESTDKIKTFTIGVPDAGLNEAPFAKDIAYHLGTDHTEYYCSEKEALDLLPSLPYIFDEPFGDASAIPTTLVSQIARQDVTVALSADAGDEIFAGYNRYDYLFKYTRNIHKIPGVFRKLMANGLDVLNSDRVPISRGHHGLHNKLNKVGSLLRDPSAKSLALSLSQQYSNLTINDLFVHEVSELHNAFDNVELQGEFYDDLSCMLAIDYQTYLADDILQKVDRATMSASLEGREPFLDHRIIELAARLPNEYKYFKGSKKHILKEINKKYIPNELMNRPKMGFGIPIVRWLKTDLKNLVDNYCNNKIIEKQGIFQPEGIKKMIKEFYDGSPNLGLSVWYLLMFQMWWDEWE